MRALVIRVAIVPLALALWQGTTEARQRVLPRDPKTITVDGKNLTVVTDKSTDPLPQETVPASNETVAAVARAYRLDTKPTKNPHLVMARREFAHWQAKQLPPVELHRTFASMRLILDAADSQDVGIRDWDVLLSAVGQLDRATPGRPNVPALVCEGTTSRAVIKQAWDSRITDPDKALACTKVVIDEWTDQADSQQVARTEAKQCTVVPKAAAMESYFETNWALADVAAAWFIRGLIFAARSDTAAARAAFEKVTQHYNCSYIWDPEGHFWRASDGAARQLARF